MILTGKQVKYRGTVTGLKISAVDGTAFIDNLPYTYRSDFSAGVDGWTATRGTAAGNIDSIGGLDNWLRFTVNTDNNIHLIKKSTTTVTSGKKYTFTFTYYIPSGQSNVDGIRLMFNGGSQGGSSIQSVTDTATTVTVSVTATTTGQIEFWPYDGASATFQDAGGDDVFYIKDVTISEITPYMDGNHQIEIYDASNRMLRGVLKAAGTGETLGTDIIAPLNFMSGWKKTSATFIDADSFSVDADYGSVFKAETTVGVLYKNAYTGSLSGFGLRFAPSGAVQVPSGSTGVYVTASQTSVAITKGGVPGTGTNDVSTCVVQQVLTPSASGATIVSAKGGETYNFSYKNPSFTYNAASYYCIVSKVR